ncbi:MAG TPA: hypothetical protein GXX39_06115 [Syntrophothermus lipocalidus]|mgnify:FL=1|uniref:Sigma-G inhibitor, Gin n=1 Tax=Syntrophothermus lipocalidus (strain DSM 12680 / TGB-C1) TaxID=643648 RepID=D7CII6_SYNLT|nr:MULTISPECIES: sigma factor G inhibitor Gin [Syntrophothermus]ADI00851.1 Sigma-G inhibitor, Gin [Syntrophothermus lipocalidus DSM 12680]NSW83379.1 sigma factor G inhibitor Gin [Syntrophothermus sp.]HHV76921.1 hypothetical protein [Syntrophothermus lipocalidus]
MQAKSVFAKNCARKGQVLPRCKLCDEVPEEGLRGGYLINGIFICRGCEAVIMRLQVGTPDYEEMLNRIKKLWE